MNRRRGERRQRRFNLVWHERRTGFDRRAPTDAGPVAALGNVVVGLRHRPGTLWVLLATANLLNVVDFAFTLNVLAIGGGEANPVMDSLIAASPVYAGLFKLAVVLLTTLLVWRLRRFRRALEAALVMVAIFAAVFFYHIIGLATLA